MPAPTVPGSPGANRVSRDDILRRAGVLPGAPRIMGILTELLQDVNTDVSDVSTLVRSDPALAGQVVRISNSVMFGGGAEVETVDEALNRVGFNEILRLVGIASLRTLTNDSLSVYGIQPNDLQQSCLLHALAAESIAHQTTGIDPGVAYTAGLVRALGMVVLNAVAQDAKAPGYDFLEYSTYAEWEQRCFGLTAADATRMILDEWRFPDAIVRAVDQHLLRATSAYSDQLACIVNVAGAVVDSAGFALVGDRQNWAKTDEKLTAAGIDNEQFDVAATSAIGYFQVQRAAM